MSPKNEADVDFKVVAEPVLAVRTLVKNISDCGGQGFLKCVPNCKCLTKKCKCRVANVLCNSRCHGKKNRRIVQIADWEIFYENFLYFDLVY